MRSRTRTLLASFASALVLATVLVITASSAAAQDVPNSPVADLTCPISARAEFTPGIALLSQPQELTGVVQGGTSLSPATPCTSLAGVPYQGFTMELTGTGHMACLTAALEGSASGTAQVSWDNGDTSTVEWSITTAAMVPVVNATVTDGPLSGASIVVAGAPTSVTGNCVLNPITNAGFVGAAEFLRLGG